MSPRYRLIKIAKKIGLVLILSFSLYGMFKGL